MPRAKNRAVRLGSYARLSRGDDLDGVSGSIVNQQQIIRQYCERSPEDLRIVREYADVQGFAVSVDSELGQGSTFTITVPEEAIVGEDDV